MPAPARQVTRPTSFIYTLMGDVVRHHGGEIWIGSLARLMAEFGISEAAVRQAVSRMTRQGWLKPRRVGNKSYYAMTDRGTERVERVSPRIYRAPQDAWDGRWRMVAYSVPEPLRERRDRFRKDLTVVGFAPLAPSLWLAPGDVLDAARESAAQCDLVDYADFFVAESRGPRSDRDLIARCWDIGAIADAYRDFVARYEARLAALEAAHLPDAQAFVEREWLVHDYRKFIYVDPGLPLSLLPRDWPAPHASAVFRAYYDVLEPAALRFFASIFKAADDRPLLPR
ncbi:MAG: PaaX family transcriptional regulator C-terminal domain-containing protein [Candidatus Velthaea sp.]